MVLLESRRQFYMNPDINADDFWPISLFFSLVPLTGPMGERYGEGMEGSAIGPSGSLALSI